MHPRGLTASTKSQTGHICYVYLKFHRACIYIEKALTSANLAERNERKFMQSHAHSLFSGMVKELPD